MRQGLVTLLWMALLLGAWRWGPWDEAEPEAQAHRAGYHEHVPAHPGGRVGMSGEFHLEIVSGADGTHRMWISNAFGQEMDPAGFEGTLTIEPEHGPAVQAPWVRVGRGTELQAVTPPLSGQAWVIVHGSLGRFARFEGMRFKWDYDTRISVHDRTWPIDGRYTSEGP